MATRKARPKKPKDELVRPTAIDRHVGSRVRQRRMMMGMSQAALAAQLGVTFQQLQKNEKGTNRFGSSRLFDLSLSLDVPIQYFFDAMPAEIAAAVGVRKGLHTFSPPNDDNAVMTRAETLRLVRAYYQIEDGRVRKRVYDLAKILASDGES
jgi:transcriptional regulator with XRE-family HTH domain